MPAQGHCTKSAYRYTGTVTQFSLIIYLSLMHVECEHLAILLQKLVPSKNYVVYAREGSVRDVVIVQLLRRSF
jgi:hypothetical protein